MIYNFHNAYCWIKGGVESGMAYRAKIFRNLGLDAKFIFTNYFPDRNIWYETTDLGFQDSEVIWMYEFFTDCNVSPVTYTLKQLEDTFEENNYIVLRDGTTVRYQFPDLNVYYLAYLADDQSDFVYQVAMISNGSMLRQDYYTYCRNYSEYYYPADGQAHLYLRRFFNKDGSVAYEEMIEGKTRFYKFHDKLLYSQEELVEYMMSCIHFTKNDVVLIDGEWGTIDKAAFLQNAYPAKTGFIIHTYHYLYSDDEHILWSEWFEYIFSHPEKISFFVTNTETQSMLLKDQFRKYKGLDVRVETIPVAYLDRIRIPKNARKKHSLITAGRLSADKNVNIIIEAVVMAKQEIPDITLDIYGEGVIETALRELIAELKCDTYITLRGFQNLDDIYQNYEAYISASFGETFGITLLEAVGSGLPIVGFDIPYGVQVFVDDGKNGFKMSCHTAKGLSDGIVRLFTESDIEAFQRRSYEIAQAYLETDIEKKWRTILS